MNTESITVSRTPNHGTTTRARKVLYWATTALTGLGFAGLGVANLVHAPALIQGLAHLGYPAYFATILGIWKVLGAVAILAPGMPRVKEWAYAGMFFTLTGAAFSHASSGDPVGNIAAPLVLLALVIVSSAMRPSRSAVVATATPAVVPA